MLDVNSKEYALYIHFKCSDEKIDCLQRVSIGGMQSIVLATAALFKNFSSIMFNLSKDYNENQAKIKHLTIPGLIPQRSM